MKKPKQKGHTLAATPARTNIPPYARDDLFRVLYGVDLAETVQHHWSCWSWAVKYLDNAKQERYSETNVYVYTPINDVLKLVLPFRSLAIADFGLLTVLAWNYDNLPKERVLKKLWARVEGIRSSMNAEQLALLQELKDYTFPVSEEDAAPVQLESIPKCKISTSAPTPAHDVATPSGRKRVIKKSKL